MFVLVAGHMAADLLRIDLPTPGFLIITLSYPVLTLARGLRH